MLQQPRRQTVVAMGAVSFEIKRQRIRSRPGFLRQLLIFFEIEMIHCCLCPAWNIYALVHEPTITVTC